MAELINTSDSEFCSLKISHSCGYTTSVLEVVANGNIICSQDVWIYLQSTVKETYDLEMEASLGLMLDHLMLIHLLYVNVTGCQVTILYIEVGLNYLRLCHHNIFSIELSLVTTQIDAASEFCELSNFNCRKFNHYFKVSWFSMAEC